jgi:signal transduction histidine kinase
LKVVLHNLIGNGIKYADFNKPGSFIQIEGEASGKLFILKISDNGIGIESGKQSKIFDMYYRGTDKSKGSGLGLFIVKEILMKLGGSIELTSTLGEGTTFIVSFETREKKS